MGKSTHFLGQPLYGQVIKLLDKAEILEISRKNGGERYIKRFDAWTHLMTMLYAVIMRHDSLREISVSMLSEARKLAHLGVSMMPTRSTLSDANARRPEVIVNIYRQRWEIELLFKQIKQNFPLRYFYGESRNAIKIQIWVTLIANLLLMVIQSRLSRKSPEIPGMGASCPQGCHHDLSGNRCDARQKIAEPPGHQADDNVQDAIGCHGCQYLSVDQL